MSLLKHFFVFCVSVCLVFDEEIIGRAPQTIPCVICLVLVHRVCSNRGTIMSKYSVKIAACCKYKLYHIFYLQKLPLPNMY